MADDVLLQRLGTAALQKAPQPLRRALDNIGVQFRPESGPVSPMAGGLGPGAHGMIAGVEHGSPNVVSVMQPDVFAKNADQLTVHETTHNAQNNWPPAIQNAIPPDNPNDPNNYGGTPRIANLIKNGGTIANLPREQGAAAMQYGQVNGWPEPYKSLANTLDDIPQSQIEMTDPMAKTINMKPRTPQVPPSSVPGMNFAQQIYQKGDPAPGDTKGQGPETAAPPPPPGFEPVGDTPPPPAGFEPLPNGLEDYPVTQTGPKTFSGPTVSPQQSIVTDLENLGKGVAKGAANTLFNAGSNTPMPSYLSGSGYTDHANVGPKPDELNPQGFAQNLGYGGEQAAEFFAPAGVEGKMAGAASEALPFLGKTIPKIGAQALTSGAVNAAQGRDFKTGAIAGGVAGALGRAAQAGAGPMAESALGVRNVDRSFGRTPGQAILQDTSGMRPGTIAKQAQSRSNVLTGELEDRAAASPVMGSTNPAVGVVDNAIAKKSGQNSPIVDDLQTLRDQLTVNRSTKAPIASDQPAMGILNLKRGVGDTVGRWPIEQQNAVKGVARQMYGALDSELDRTVPGSNELNQRISSLIPVANRASAKDLNANLLQRSLGRFGKHTGALGMAGLGSVMGKQEGGTKGAIEGGIIGLVGPEFLASPTTMMVGARALNTLSQPIARYTGGAAAQLFKPQKQQ